MWRARNARLTAFWRHFVRASPLQRERSMNATTEHKGTTEKVTEKIADKAEKASSRIRHELRADGSRLDVKKALAEVKSFGHTLESQMRTRPYVALAATAGVSFLAGSILGTRVGRLALAAGAGYLATRVLERTDLTSIESALKNA
jgi:ElaB/YqjD/DUF883 family membrane-anchored ribosome-binding protein